jgi:hypothetical protein
MVSPLLYLKNYIRSHDLSNKNDTIIKSYKTAIQLLSCVGFDFFPSGCIFCTIIRFYLNAINHAINQVQAGLSAGYGIYFRMAQRLLI